MKNITYKDLRDFIKHNPDIPDEAKLKVDDNFFTQLNKLSKETLCSCYREEIRKEPRYNIYTGRIDYYVDVVHSVCWGTRECDPCDCNGNIQKCTHYPEKRSGNDK